MGRQVVQRLSEALRRRRAGPGAAATATRRNRPTSDPAATTSATRTIRAATQSPASGRFRAGTPSGLAMSGYSGRNGAGSTTDPSSHSTGAVAAMRAHQRQRGDGSRPVG
jgi:hypothetical protein